jgi:hypothetical protein
MHARDGGSTTVRGAAAALGLAAALVTSQPAFGHVQPAVDENNRYLKLTPLGDRVRLSYTVFLGEKPGATLRRQLDRDRDGQLSDAEARAYGEDLAARIRAAVTVTLDGRTVPVRWTTLDVGLGVPAVTAGAFSVDLVGWICASSAAPRLALRDTLRLERPGESELRLEAGPGIHLGSRRLADRPLERLETQWRGPGGPLEIGLEVSWRVDDAAPRPGDGQCRAPTDAGDAGDAGPRWWPIAIALAAAAAAAATLLARRRASSRRVSGT